MAYAPPPTTHFDGGKNLARGQIPDSETDLAGYLRKIRTGSHVFSAGATYAVEFSEAFANANYVVSFGETAVTGLPIWASKTAAGFSLIAAAACTVDWIAIHD